VAGGIDWFRWHHGSVTDHKFQLVAKRAAASVAEVIAVWASLLEAASMSSQRGTPGEPDLEAMECGLGLDEGKAARIYTAMMARDLVTSDGAIVSWSKRQPRRERDDDSSTERVQAFRQRKRHETPGNAEELAGTPRVEKKREEEKKEEEANAVCADSTGPVAARRETKRGTRLPADWVLQKAWGDWALTDQPHWTPDIVRRVAEGFADHWHAKTGADATSLDWLARWRNWCRSDITRKAHPPPRNGNHSMTAGEQAAQRRILAAVPGLAARSAPLATVTEIIDVPAALLG
jgi:hypothetical protein